MEARRDSLSILSPDIESSNGINASVLLTPGRTRNIAQDMEALRLSRQDNPFLQQVMASRESLIDCNVDDCEDDAILMSQDFSHSTLDFFEDDPVTLKEVHDHMIRSPPPISCWPHESGSQRVTSAFDFNGDGSVSFSTYSVNSDMGKELLPSSTSFLRRSPLKLSVKMNNSDDSYFQGNKVKIQHGRQRSKSRPISPMSRDSTPSSGRPLSLPGESHLKLALNRNRANNQAASQNEKYTKLHHPVPLRRANFDSEDSVHLVQYCDK